MKRLITGPGGQDKLGYALKSAGLLEADAAFELGERGTVLARAHLAIRHGMEKGLSHEELEAALLRYDTVTADEIGAGVIPLNPFERAWREEAGRLLCAYAKEADVVERMLCGIPILIKGENFPS